MEKNKRETTVLVAGDFLPTENNLSQFETKSGEELIGDELLELINAADYSIANLEGPLTDKVSPVSKFGPTLYAPENTIHGIDKLGIKCFSIANNHILDCGEVGMANTIKLLTQHGKQYVGAGDNLNEAKKPLIIDCGIRIGIYACAEYEFTIATEKEAGANPFDELYIGDDIAALRKQVDYMIVLYHGMKEYYRYPAPYVMRRCRYMVEKGADFVFCQHSHCIGCRETYHQGEILYGQGNFLFNHGKDNEFTKSGLLVKITLPERSIEFVPIVRHECLVRKANEIERHAILNEFNIRSGEIQREHFVESNYEMFCRNLESQYACQALGVLGKVMRKTKLMRFYKKNYPRNSRLNLLNNIRCEAHRDVIISFLRSSLKE